MGMISASRCSGLGAGFNRLKSGSALLVNKESSATTAKRIVLAVLKGRSRLASNHVKQVRMKAAMTDHQGIIVVIAAMKRAVLAKLDLRRALNDMELFVQLRLIHC